MVKQSTLFSSVIESALVEGDAVDVLRRLPPASVHLVVTDPAYESLEKHRAKGSTTRLAQSDASSNEWFDVFPNARYPALLEEFYRVLVDDAHCYIMCDEETCELLKPIARRAGFTVWKSLIWAKVKQRRTSDDCGLEPRLLAAEQVKIGMGYHWRNSTERILFLEKGKRRLSDLSLPDILFAPPVSRRYPTEKPEVLIEPLLLNSSSPDEVVCDPFVGSGAVAAVAHRLGRRYIAADIRTEVAASRLSVVPVALDAFMAPGQ